MASSVPGQTLPRRPLGATGLELSVLGFGGSPLGGIFESIDEAEAVRAVHEAFKLGINYFDVSPYYGLTKAESLLGRALKDLPREQFVLSTKVGRYGMDEFDFSAARVTASVEESCQRLNVEYIDIIICHDVEFVDLQQIVDETLPALHKLKESGKVKFIGISGLPLKVFTWVLEHAKPGSLDVVLSYCHYCLNDTSLLELIPVLKDKGVGLISAAPLCMGLLTTQGPPSWHPASAELKAACSGIMEKYTEQAVDIPALALKFSTECDDIASTLVGMCTRDQVRQNASAILQTMSSEDRETVSSIQQALPSKDHLTWTSGLPQNN